ncbi:MAG TPA: sigma-70 family RNA polymerase sigma factor [Chloroflexota bacterium]|nr:sigma-70 family RNA polymerase sigma factor [Chloroflexota bacterium]
MADGSQDIVRRAQAGDPEALRELITSQQTYVYSICRGLMKNEADAADMTQDAFMRVLRSLHTYRGETKFTTWLYRLVTNVCLDELRRRGTPAIALDAGDDERSIDPADPDPWVQPERWADAAEDAALVQQALAELSTPQRLALTLFYFDDLHYEDIAQVMNVPLNTVKSHIRRAKERLAELLTPRSNGKELSWTAAR